MTSHTALRRLSAIGATAAAVVAVSTAPAWSAEPPPTDVSVPEPSTFTSTLTATLGPDQVRDDAGKPVPGQPGATGMFTLRVNSMLEIVCYDITVMGVTPPYASSSRTATHLQEGAPDESGYPRMVFPDPSGAPGGPQTSKGCLKGPFTTGVIVNGTDTGTGFTLKQVEANPAAWFVDVHTEQFRAGAVRGQLAKSG